MATTVRTHKSHTVYYKSTWGAAWVAVPYLYANRFSVAVAPSTSSAVLEYQYGRILRSNANLMANYTQLDLTDKYIKIAVDGGWTWYGVCVDVDDQRDGEAIHEGTAIVTGKQNFLCRGLEYLLQREPVTQSIVKNTAAGETTIGRAIGFNLGAGLPGSAYREANASNELGSKGTAIFTSNLQSASEWKSHQILEYLIKNFFPRNQAGLDMLDWNVDINQARQYLSAYKPTLQIHGKTCFQILNELIDRRRALGWWIYVDPDNEHPEIRIFSFSRDNVNLPDGNIILANTNQTTWNFDRDNRVQVCTLATDTASKFDRVYVKGEPPGAVFTIEGSGGGGNGLLEADWTSAQQTEYRTAASTAAGYNALDSWSKQNANQAARGKEKLRKVFRYFRLSPTAFTGTLNGKPVWPYDSTAQGLTINTSYWIPGIRFQDKLPLRLEHDYQVVATVTNTMKDRSKWEYQRPFVYIKDNDVSKYFFLDRPGRGDSVGTHITASGRNWAASLRMQDDAPGIIVDVGVNQHLIAKDTFTPIDEDDTQDCPPDVDYNYLAATVFAEGDGNVTVMHPEGPLALTTDTIKELILFAPNCRLDYMLPQTTIDIDNEGALIKCTAGGFIQDDTAYMRNVANSAYQWYSTPRKAMQVTIHELSFIQLVDANNGLGSTPSPGVLLRTVGSGANAQTINSVVSQVEYDLLAGTGTYTTQFAELDFE
jgi:hypothetical protein